MRYGLVTKAETIANYFQSLSLLLIGHLGHLSPLIGQLRLSVFLPSPVAMLWTCLAASLLLGPISALIPELRPEQMDLLILRWKLLMLETRH